jgi:hypothetical protein
LVDGEAEPGTRWILKSRVARRRRSNRDFETAASLDGGRRCQGPEPTFELVCPRRGIRANRGFVVNVTQHHFHAHHRHGPVGSVRARGVTSHPT